MAYRLMPAGKPTEHSDTFRFHNVRDCIEPNPRQCHVQPCPAQKCGLRPAYVCINPRTSNQGMIRVRCDNCPSMREPNRQRSHRPVTQPGMYCDQGQYQSYAPPPQQHRSSAQNVRCDINITADLPLPKSRSCMYDYQTPTCTRPTPPRVSCSANPPRDYAPQASQWLDNNMYMIREEPVKDTYSIFPAYTQEPMGQDARRRNSKEIKHFETRLYAKHYPNLGSARASRPPVLHSKNSRT